MYALKKVWGWIVLLLGIGIGLLIAVFRVSQDVSSDRESAKRLREGLDNGKDRVSDAERVIAEAKSTVGSVEITTDKLGKSIDRSSDAIADGLGILDDIKKQNGG